MRMSISCPQTEFKDFIKHSEYFSTVKLILMLLYLRNIFRENADINYFM